MKTILLLGIAAALATSLRGEAPTTLPSTRPAAFNPLLDAQRRQVALQRDMYERMPIAATYPMDQVVRLTPINGFLRADFGAAVAVAGQGRFKVEGCDATWVSRSVINTGLNQGTFTYINRFDFDLTEAGQTWQTTLSCNESHLSIGATGLGFSIHYQQSNGNIVLSALKNENGRYRSVLYLTARSLGQLQAEHPAEVREHLVPLLRRWTSEELLSPGPVDVYLVFTELPAPIDVGTRVAELLPRLDDDSFVIRDAASDELAELGRQGIHAVMRMDRSHLSLEQEVRLDLFLATGRRRSIEDIDAARRDLDFLMDCLEDPDAAVRAAAKDAIEKVAGHPVVFEVSADAISRRVAVEELRATMKYEADLKSMRLELKPPLPADEPVDAAAAYRLGRDEYRNGDWIAARRHLALAHALGFKPGLFEDPPEKYLARMDRKEEADAAKGIR